ncbi:MAG: tRNA (adenosine(37)-N6)-dimethylallyltransferase MiaA [Candidatus Manganitrophus sp.]|nr:tRNA (adenosine(37)-N6)-dimethylallyltransferase MiaA [Candidatus Manganitrophus sp.]MDC4223762.1 tRNA (adenosine(37)-N6)-dimethylallyltransferase MiaA [Candidatus Manganitrophus sp.]WDT69655.1 MAG: tRNA (adenosine(37)-N6)-dimethylallyltransferase MiaA [Candidatus Manganitrophus sp.]WDT78735.1 MAG: tRNA (adenosine(37)-N6)-dimethylallyltransferase MiaA [Candidatus Manganitrophus sp.]
MILVGPTAVGKSAVAERLALALGTDILVADSRQIYQGMDIGTDKPSPESRARVPRHLIDLVPPDGSFSAGKFKKLAEEKITALSREGKPIFIEGGTGLYIKTLLYGLWEGPPADWDLRRRLLQEESEKGEGILHRRLAEVDPAAAERIHPRDLPKLVRALEVYHQTGRPISEVHADHRFAEPPKGAYCLIGLRRDREDLYQRIEQRVEAQIAKGLIEETAGLLSAGFSPELPSMRGLGYKQMTRYIRGEQTREEAIATLKRDTRHYAKRQMTWFRADPKIEWIDLRPDEAPEEAADRILRLKYLKSML